MLLLLLLLRAWCCVARAVRYVIALAIRCATRPVSQRFPIVLLPRPKNPTRASTFRRAITHSLRILRTSSHARDPGAVVYNNERTMGQGTFETRINKE